MTDASSNRAEHQRDLEDAETLRQLARDVPGLGSAIPTSAADRPMTEYAHCARRDRGGKFCAKGKPCTCGWLNPDNTDPDATRNHVATLLRDPFTRLDLVEAVYGAECSCGWRYTGLFPMDEWDKHVDGTAT